MGRRLLIFSVGLALSITLIPILITALQKDAPRRGANPNPSPPPRIDQEKGAEPKAPIGNQPTQTRIDGPVTIQGTIETINPSTGTDEATRRQQQSQTDANWALVWVGAVAAFFAASAFVAGLWQGWNTHKQVGIMRKQFDATYVPRIEFVGLTAIDWEDGKEPVLFATYRNNGLAASSELHATMSIKLGNMDMGSSEARFVIAGKETRQHFQALGRSFSAAFWANINSGGVPFCVRISFAYEREGKQESKGYCMEYLAWADPRPRHVPLFVFCTGKCLAKDQPTPEWLKPKAIVTTSSGITVFDIAISSQGTSGTSGDTTDFAD